MIISQSLLFSFNSTASGQSISFDYNLDRNKLQIGFGLGVNISKYKPEKNYNELFYKKLNPEKLHEYFALKTYIHYKFISQPNFNLYGFYDLQIRRGGAKSQIFSGYGYDSTLIITKPEEGIIYNELILEYGPYFWLENTFGIGFDLDFNEKFYLRHRFGVGSTLVLGTDKGNDIVNHTGSIWVIGYLINIGVGYKLK